MSDIGLALAWSAAVLLFVGSGFFSGSETALMAINRLRLRRLAEDGDKRAAKAEKLLTDPGSLLSGILLGNNFANIMLASLATALAQPVWGELAPLYVSPVLTVLLLVFAEIVPKTLAANRTLAVARFCARPLGAFLFVTRPLTWVASRIATAVLGPFARPIEDDTQVSHEDLKTIAQVGREAGSMESVTLDILHGLSELSQGSVRDVLVPRHQIVSMPIDEGVEGFEDIVRRKGHTRIPVWELNREDIKGVLHAKDLLHRPGRSQTPREIRDMLRPAVFVPESTPLSKAIRLMQDSKSQMVFVVDEYGGLEGLVTLKDVLEELIGEIEDEHDKTSRRVDVVREGVIVADANVTLRYLKRKTGVDFTNSSARTLGGLLVVHQPNELEPGQKIEIEGATFTVLSMHERFLKKVRIEYPVAPPASEAV